MDTIFSTYNSPYTTMVESFNEMLCSLSELLWKSLDLPSTLFSITDLEFRADPAA